uniref:Uncharacterized protein n=1 Tax=Anguilla anguilla TaxID=7936 RepID=A0A0E9WR83_ANGAN
MKKNCIFKMHTSCIKGTEQLIKFGICFFSCYLSCKAGVHNNLFLGLHVNFGLYFMSPVI